MAINTIQGYAPSTTEPIDSRFIKSNESARYAMTTFESYEGLPVYQQDTKQWYILIDITNINNAAGWKIVGSDINTGSFVTTSSFNAFTSSYSTGSFTGSFIGTSTFALTASHIDAGFY
jgi:hypothetical protein